MQLRFAAPPLRRSAASPRARGRQLESPALVPHASRELPAVADASSCSACERPLHLAHPQEMHSVTSQSSCTLHTQARTLYAHIGERSLALNHIVLDRSLEDNQTRGEATCVLLRSCHARTEGCAAMINRYLSIGYQRRFKACEFESHARTYVRTYERMYVHMPRRHSGLGFQRTPFSAHENESGGSKSFGCENCTWFWSSI